MPFEGVRDKFRGVSVERSERILPILVYFAAVLRRSVTYKELGQIVGAHWRNLGRPLSFVGIELEELRRKWRDRDLPLIQFLVSNQQSGMPGEGGLNWLLNDLPGKRRAGTANTPTKRRDAVRFVQDQIFEYRHWADVLDYFDLEPYRPADRGLHNALDRLSRQPGRGGIERREHLRLKYYIAGNPERVGLPRSSGHGTTEYVFPSKDRADVMFDRGHQYTAIEVKSRDASEDEITRGMFQAIKYKMLCEACAVADARSRHSIRSILVLEGRLPATLEILRDAFEIEVCESVVVPPAFRLPPDARPMVTELEN